MMMGAEAGLDGGIFFSSLSFQDGLSTVCSSGFVVLRLAIFVYIRVSLCMVAV
ncbi:hypothetical protein BGW80DRAFT_1338614 [Lactifluus volemus]|nr:hypothetical protein BGW80DRAFT_1338614 [Lactifluus volemus]